MVAGVVVVRKRATTPLKMDDWQDARNELDLLGVAHPQCLAQIPSVDLIDVVLQPSENRLWRKRSVRLHEQIELVAERHVDVR